MDLANIDIEEFKKDYPELYNELKKDIADIVETTGRVLKSVKASSLSPSLVSQLTKNGLLDLNPNTEDLLSKRAEQEEQQKAKQASKVRQ